MGSVNKKQAQVPANEKLVSVQTTELKDRLNRIYSRTHSSTSTRGAELGHFDSLWDLKELALLEHRQTLEVPETWLAEAVEQDHVKHGH
jgi:hypothetical protein